MIHQEIIIAGFGGQGILSAGTLLAYAGMFEGMNVSWLPSYGPEKRGGTANCHVVVTEEEVGSPVLNSATSIIALNTPSFDKFESFAESGGIVIYDSSLVQSKPGRKDVQYFAIPATSALSEKGNSAYAGIMLLGCLVRQTGLLSRNSFEKALYNVLPEKKHYLIPEEMEVFDRGYNMEF